MKNLLLIILTIISSLSFAQNFQEDFGKAFQEGDTLKQKEILNKWETDNYKDAELYTSYYNYYFSKSKQEMLTMSTERPEGESLSIEDSTGKTAGYLGSKIVFNESVLQKGLDKIDEGIKLYPDRLDMRFGKIYALGQIEDWERFTTEIIKTVKYSAKNNSKWTWTNNELKSGGKDEFLLDIQDYQLDLYNTGDDDLLINMRSIANEVLKIYPDHIESLTNVSITYLLTKEYDKAIETLQIAEKLNPKDAIVLNNIAQGYKLKGDYKKSIEYYKKTIKYGNERNVQYAKQQIDELKNK